MMPNRRKLVLYGGLALMAIVFVGDSAMRNFVTKPLEMAERKETALRKRANTRRLELKKANKALDQLAELQQRSLPSDPQLARSHYQAWLLQLVQQAGWKGPNVDSGEPQSQKGLYRAFPFTVRGRGTLDQVTRFLYAFYQAGHLHKIRSLTLNPLQGAEQFDVSLTIEALSLKGASSTDKLTQLASGSLASPHLADYQTLVRRNIFRVGDTNLRAKSTLLTAITTDVHGTREAWFSTAKSSKTHVLHEGDSLAIGTLSAKVIQIHDDRVIVEMDGQQRGVTIGKSLAEAALLPAEA